MSGQRLIALPVTFLFFLVLIFLIILLPLIVSGAFRALGFDLKTTVALFLFSLFGSAINIPLHTVRHRGVVTVTRPKVFFGFIYPEAKKEYRVTKTTIAINLGGALIPIFICAYLVFGHLELLWQFLVGAGIVSIICYKLARPVPGIGITLPALVPPFLAAIVALLMPGGSSIIIAYVSGVVGVLFGADLLNLNEITRSGVRVLSIGGAGTFDGIFLTGIVSVLLVA